jgi:hypothetical protein
MGVRPRSEPVPLGEMARSRGKIVATKKAEVVFESRDRNSATLDLSSNHKVLEKIPRFVRQNPMGTTRLRWPCTKRFPL